MTTTPPESNVPAEASPSKKKALRKLLIPIVILSAVIVLLGASSLMIWAVTIKHSENVVVRQLSNWLPIPAAKVGDTTLLYRDFLKARVTLKTFLKSEAAKKQGMPGELDAALEGNILEKMIAEAALEELAATKNVTVSEEELRAKFADIITAVSSTTPDVGLYLLQNFGWNEEDFRQEVLRPALLEQQLAIIMAGESSDDPNALGVYMEGRMKAADVVRYLKF